MGSARCTAALSPGAAVQDAVGDRAEDDDAKAYHLCLFERSDHETVRSQSLHEETFQRVKHPVEQQDLTFEFPVFIHIQQEQEEKETPNRFVEKSGVAGLSVDIDSPRQIGGTAVRFGVEIISPSADGLRKCDGGNAKIHQIEGPHFPEITKQETDADSTQIGRASCRERV